MKKEFPEWAKILYRGIRAAIAAGLAQTIVLKPDWTNPKETLTTLGIAFATGFTVSFGMWLRDKADEWFEWKPDGLFQRLLPI